MKEFKVGRLVRIKKFADGDTSGYGHKLKDVGVISKLSPWTSTKNKIHVVVPGRISTSGQAPAVSYDESDLVLL